MKIRLLIMWFFMAFLQLNAAYAQTQTSGSLPFVTLDRTKLFSDTLFGQNVLALIEFERKRQAKETREIEKNLELEEKELAEKRDIMEQEIFRAAAISFDMKVKKLREDGDQREARFTQYLASEQRRFYERVTPILGRLLREIGAVAIVDRRAILLAIQNLDITDLAISRIDAEIGDGVALDKPVSVPGAANLPKLKP